MTEETKKPTHILTIKIPMLCIDDPHARMLASQIVAKIPNFLIENGEIKLQKIFDGKPPVKVEL